MLLHTIPAAREVKIAGPDSHLHSISIVASKLIPLCPDGRINGHLAKRPAAEHQAFGDHCCRGSLLLGLLLSNEIMNKIINTFEQSNLIQAG